MKKLSKNDKIGIIAPITILVLAGLAMFIGSLILRSNYPDYVVSQEEAIERSLRRYNNYTFDPVVLGMKQPFPDLRGDIWVWEIDMNPEWMTDEHFPFIYYVCIFSGYSVQSMFSSLMLTDLPPRRN